VNTISIIALVIGFVSAFLVILLFVRLLQVDNAQKLNRHRSTKTGLADMLSYASVINDGVVVGKNGALMASWLYRGSDDASSTNEQREAVSRYINSALARLGNGWMIHVDCVRRISISYPNANQSHFTDPICASIDNERRKLFESLGTMYDGYFVLSVTWLPPLIATQKLGEMMFDDNQGSPLFLSSGIFIHNLACGLLQLKQFCIQVAENCKYCS